MKSFRKGYFNDYIFEKKVKPNGKVQKKYSYRGYWYTFCDSPQEKKRLKILYIILEVIALISFIFAATRSIDFNLAKLPGALTGLSIVAWIAELSGVFSFCISKTYITEGDYKSIDKRISYGSLIRGILLILVIAAGFYYAGGWAAEIAPALAGYLLSVCMSFAIYRLHRKVMFHIYRNDNGEVGSEYY